MFPVIANLHTYRGQALETAIRAEAGHALFVLTNFRDEDAVWL